MLLDYIDMDYAYHDPDALLGKTHITSDIGSGESSVKSPSSIHQLITLFSLEMFVIS